MPPALNLTEQYADEVLVHCSLIEICDPAVTSDAEAIRLARLGVQKGLQYDIRIVERLFSLLWADAPDLVVVSRVMGLAAAVASGGRLFGALRSAMSHDNPWIRSKAALELTKNVCNLRFLKRLVADDDPRVRANMLEAVCDMDLPQAETLFLNALDDPHHRVALNAVYGLYRLDPVGNAVTLRFFLNHPNPGHRIAAAWLIRKVGRLEHRALLRGLVRDRLPEVRRAGFRALIALHTPRPIPAIEKSEASSGVEMCGADGPASTAPQAPPIPAPH